MLFVYRANSFIVTTVLIELSFLFFGLSRLDNASFFFEPSITSVINVLECSDSDAYIKLKLSNSKLMATSKRKIDSYSIF